MLLTSHVRYQNYKGGKWVAFTYVESTTCNYKGVKKTFIVRNAKDNYKHRRKITESCKSQKIKGVEESGKRV